MSHTIRFNNMAILTPSLVNQVILSHFLHRAHFTPYNLTPQPVKRSQITSE